MARHVKFINYTNIRPFPYRGILILEINGIGYYFNRYLNHFWFSGGTVNFNENNSEIVKQDDWVIDLDFLPKNLHKYASEILEVLIENIESIRCD